MNKFFLYQIWYRDSTCRLINNCDKLKDNLFKEFDFTGVKNSPFPIFKIHRLTMLRYHAARRVRIK